MASPSLNSYTRPLKREWERLTLGLTTVLFLAIGAFMAMSFMNALKTNDPGRVSGHEVPAEFSDRAFAYLTDDGQGHVQGRHAFMLPRNVRPLVVVNEPPPTPPPVVPPNQDPVTTVPPVVVKDPVVPPVKPPIKDPVVVKPPPPPPEPPAIRHYVTYKGFMTLPSSGDARAVLRYERTRGDESRGSDSLLETGGKLRGFEIESFDENQIVLKPRDGETIIVRKGERLEIDR